MKNSPLYIVTGKNVGIPCSEPQTYSDPIPYTEALALMQGLESETNREDITFDIIEA